MSDRNKLQKIIRELDEVARSGLSQEQSVQESIGRYVNPTALAQVAEQRMDLSFRNFAQQGKPMEFSDVKDITMGALMEGFMIGVRFGEGG